MCGATVALADRAPVRVGEDRRDGIGEEGQRHQHEHLLGHPVGAADDEQPDADRGDRHRRVLRHARERERGPDADELADADAEVRDQHGDRRERRPADPVLLPDQLGEALARDRAHPRRHLLHDDQRDVISDHHPDQVVAVLRADRRVGRDTAGVVAGVGGDQSRAEEGEQREETREARATRPQPWAPGQSPVAHGGDGGAY